MNFSIVIITKNEAAKIRRTLESIRRLSDDILIVDSGSTDDTIRICQQYNCRIISTEWQGYGNTKNLGNKAAKHDWILSLDADEVVDETLFIFLTDLTLQDEQLAYEIKRQNYFMQQPIYHGGWSNDRSIRFFNRKNCSWNAAPVHESLVFNQPPQIRKAKGCILHYTYDSLQEYQTKLERYAQLNALKYFRDQKKAGFVKRYLSPGFKFFNEYILKKGFLDGYNGLLITKMSAKGVRLKYQLLHQLNKNALSEKQK